jgi:hypothetical protein
LSRIDKDGEGLRYHNRRDGNKSLSDYSLANLEVVRDALNNLSKVLSALRYRMEDFVNETTAGAHTKSLSRQDLISIAKILSTLDLGKGLLFELKKQRIQSRYRLNDDEFCEAVNVIKNNREMKALIGEETSLLYLPDHLIVSIVEQWRKLQPHRTVSGPATVETVDAETIRAMKEHYRVQTEVVSAVQTLLTDEQLAELETICSLGRYGGFSESYENGIQGTKGRHALEKNAPRQIADLMDKTDFLGALMKAVRRLGRPSLANRLSGM